MRHAGIGKPQDEIRDEEEEAAEDRRVDDAEERDAELARREGDGVERGIERQPAEQDKRGDEPDQRGEEGGPAALADEAREEMDDDPGRQQVGGDAQQLAVEAEGAAQAMGGCPGRGAPRRGRARGPGAGRAVRPAARADARRRPPPRAM